MVTDPAHHDLLVTCLRSLQRDPAAARYELLTGGISGASTYRVDLGNESIVVKIADVASSQAVLQRVRRESSFYRLLAGSLPVRVPAVLGSSENAPAHWLCLRAYNPAPPIQTWPQQHYVEIAQELGRFHAVFWDRTHDLSQLPWLRKLDRPPNATNLRQAVESWRALAAQPHLQTVLPSDQLAWIQRMVWRVDRLEPLLRDFPTTLRHGDCHHSNLLLDEDGRWRWADWQEVGIGRGPEDLSFFFQRARMAGGTVPEDVAITA